VRKNLGTGMPDSFASWKKEKVMRAETGQWRWREVDRFRRHLEPTVSIDRLGEGHERKEGIEENCVVEARITGSVRVPTQWCKD
jgi:hypothetical protein